MKNNIKHVGEVIAVTPSCVKVKIIQSSACAACKAAKQCQATESKEKIVDVYGMSPTYQVGQKVLVTAAYGVGWYALLIAMIIPMFVMLVCLVSCMAAGLAETESALLSLGSLIPYYIIVYFFRNRINRKVSFSIKSL